MNRMKRSTGHVDFEKDTLVYRITGKGTPLLLIAGGGGDGDLYLPLADALADSFKVITYDRRANAKSTMHSPDTFDLAQQARDAVAVLEAAGETGALVFGNSSGAVIALEMARLYPEHVWGVIAHEPPIAGLHPDSAKWQEFFKDCYDSSFRWGGPSMAASKFLFGIQVPPAQMIAAQMAAMKHLRGEPKEPNMPRIPSKLASKYLIEQELLPVTNYEPDFDDIRASKQKYVIAVGSYAIQHDTFLFQIAKRFAEKIGVHYIEVPGHHGSFMDMPDEWAKSMRKIAASIQV